VSTHDELAFPVDRGSELPVGVQLARRLRAAVLNGTLAAGERAPSIRRLAEGAGVDPNTVRAVYQRLEDEGVLRSEQGRGTFAVGTESSERGTRRALQAEITRLEAELVRRPHLQRLTDPESASPAPAGRLLSTGELAQVRDELLDRLQRLDAARADVLRRLSEIDGETAGTPAQAAPAPRRSSYTTSARARIRWT